MYRHIPAPSPSNTWMRFGGLGITFGVCLLVGCSDMTTFAPPVRTTSLAQNLGLHTRVIADGPPRIHYNAWDTSDATLTAPKSSGPRDLLMVPKEPLRHGERVLISVQTIEFQSELCPFGGVRTATGLDRNDDGVLELDEIFHSSVFCNDDPKSRE